MLDWNELPFFLAVAKRGSLSGAAKQLMVNHSTVFRRINTLEEKLGVRLFERLAEGYQLTESGRMVMQHAERAQDAIHALERAVIGKDFALAGEVRISAPVSIANHIIAPRVAELRRALSGIKTQLIVSNALHDLSKRDADIAIRATNNPPEHLIGRKVTDFVWCAYASKAYLRKHSVPKNVQDLHTHQLIGPDDSLLHIDAYQRWGKQFASDQFVCSASDVNTIAVLCAQHLGVSILPSGYFDSRLVKLFKVEPEFLDGLWILMHPDLRQVARIRAVSDFLYKHMIKLEL